MMVVLNVIQTPEREATLSCRLPPPAAEAQAWKRCITHGGRQNLPRIESQCRELLGVGEDARSDR
jgi:hypothetical protein